MITQKQTWSVIVFCYNEAETVRKVVLHTREVLEKIASTYEIVIVDDGSDDGSRKVVEQLSKEVDFVRAVIHETNLGIGKALRSGYDNVQYENVCAVPADGQFDVEELLVHEHIPANTFISFYRKENTTYTLARNALSYFNRKLNLFINGFDLKDVNWVKVYKNQNMKQICPYEIESSLIESEICAKLLRSGCKVNEVKSKYLPREAGVSKGASWKIVRQAMKDTLFLTVVLWKFRKKSRVIKKLIIQTNKQSVYLPI
ncbi:MAG: glycosyltransferase family 2 protein [Spirosomataceae bacterium]